MGSLALNPEGVKQPTAEALEVRPDIVASEVTIPQGGTDAATFSDEAMATLILRDYETARGWLENNSWYLEWEWSDLLYQSPTLNYDGAGQSASDTPRVSDFTVNNAVTTMGGEVKRQIFAQQVPFVLRPRRDTSEISIKAWTALIDVLLKRANFEYELKRGINTMTLQGTMIAKAGWHTRKYTKLLPKRKGAPKKETLPVGGEHTVPTKESETFELVEKEVTESWPYFEYRELGTTIFDPKWAEYNHADRAGYAIDIDYVTVDDLAGLAQLDCYKIPDLDKLIETLFANPSGSASEATDISNNLSSSGAPAQHAESQSRNTSVNPLEKPLKLISRFDKHRRGALLLNEGNGQKFCIQNELSNDTSRPIPHFSAVWRWVQNTGYGIGLGRLAGCQQRVKQGVINHALRSLAYRFNAPLLTAQGTNAPTQNVLMRLGGFFPVAGQDVNKAVGFLPIPPVPPEAWQMLQWGDKSADENAGNDPAMSEGNISQRGSSAARTATGAARVAQKSDQRAADPIDNITEGVIVPVIEYFIDMVKMLKMPIAEIRDCLEEKLSAKILREFDMEKFLTAEMEVRVLAGQKLAVKASIAQILPLIMQFVQQPEIVKALHDEGKTVDFAVIMDLMIQFSELIGQPDIVRDMTPKEQQMVEAAAQHPALTAAQTAIQKEQLRGQNKIAEVQAKGQTDLQTHVAEQAVDKGIERLSGGQPLERAEGFDERKTDEQDLEQGVPGL